MNNKGITLVECIVAIIISGVVLLALTCQFIAQQNFVKVLFDQSTAISEASIVMNHMTRTLRFASISLGPINVVANTSITATIEPGHLNNITSSTQVVYQLSGNTMQYQEGAAAPFVNIGSNIAAFVPSWNLAANQLTIQLTAQTRNSNNVITKTFTIESIIVPLPNAG